MGSKVVNFDKLFLHQFSTKIDQTWRDGVKTSKKSKKIIDFPNIFKKGIFKIVKKPVGGVVTR